MTESPITLFIPFGEGYGKPGLTLRADSLREINSQLGELSENVSEDKSLLDDILDGVLTVKAGITLKFPQETKPVAKQTVNTTVQPPAGATPNCSHGEMKYKEGVSRASGKAYAGYFCPAPQGVPGGQCKPQFA